MTEAELMQGICDALSLCGWVWTHLRRSDGVTVGSVGLPDIIAFHPTREIVLAWELKREGGQATYEQIQWLAGLHDRRVDARIVRPRDYDDALEAIINGWPSVPVEPSPGDSRWHGKEWTAGAGPKLTVDETRRLGEANP